MKGVEKSMAKSKQEITTSQEISQLCFIIIYIYTYAILSNRHKYSESQIVQVKEREIILPVYFVFLIVHVIRSCINSHDQT